MTDPEPIADQVLAERLAAAHDAHQAALDLLAASGHLSTAQRDAAVRVAGASYERARALARVEHGTGWQTWAGVNGELYARRPNSSPPLVARGVDEQHLRTEIDRLLEPVDHP